jgi:hypothetical protein
MDIDSLSLEMAESMIEGEGLSKAIPPKLYYRLRAWLRHMHPTNMPREELKQKVTAAIAEKMEELTALNQLKKNEFMASLYDSGTVKLDFGSDVPEEVKKAAMGWAKRKGLRPIEASLNKSAGTVNTMVYSSSENTLSGRCVKRLKWELPN